MLERIYMVGISVSQQVRETLSQLQAVTIFISRPWKCTKILKITFLSISDFKLRKSFQATVSSAKKNIDTDQTLEITRRQIVLLKTVYPMNKNDIAADNFIPVMELQAASGCSDASVF